jgi:hypothetical protein
MNILPENQKSDSITGKVNSSLTAGREMLNILNDDISNLKKQNTEFKVEIIKLQTSRQQDLLLGVNITLLLVLFILTVFYFLIKKMMNARFLEYSRKSEQRHAELINLVAEQEHKRIQQNQQYSETKDALVKVFSRNYKRIASTELNIMRSMMFDTFELKVFASAVLWGVRYLVRLNEKGISDVHEVNHVLQVIEESVKGLNLFNIKELDLEEVNVALNKLLKIELQGLNKTLIYRIKGDVNSIFYTKQKLENLG